MNVPASIEALAIDGAAQMIAALLECSRLALDDEILLQGAIADLLMRNGIKHMREFRLSDHDIIDFLLPGPVPGMSLGLEVKIKGGRHAIYRQCERYCGFDVVRGLILATNVAMALPSPIAGKPTFVAHLGRGWL